MKILKLGLFLSLLAAYNSNLYASANSKLKNAVLLSFTHTPPCVEHSGNCAAVSVGEYFDSRLPIKIESGSIVFYDVDSKTRFVLNEGLHRLHRAKENSDDRESRISELLKASPRTTASSATRQEYDDKCRSAVRPEASSIWVARCQMLLPVNASKPSLFPEHSNYLEFPLNDASFIDGKFAIAAKEKCEILTNSDLNTIRNRWIKDQYVTVLDKANLKWRPITFNRLADDCSAKAREEIETLKKALPSESEQKIAISEIYQSYGLHYDAARALQDM